MPLKDTFTGPEPLVVSVVAGEVLEEFILEAFLRSRCSEWTKGGMGRRKL